MKENIKLLLGFILVICIFFSFPAFVIYSTEQNHEYCREITQDNESVWDSIIIVKEGYIACCVPIYKDHISIDEICKGYLE